MAVGTVFPGGLDTIGGVSSGQVVASALPNLQSSAIMGVEDAVGVHPGVGVMEGRLSLSNLLPVTVNDVTGLSAVNVYLLPFRGGRIALWLTMNGVTGWYAVYLPMAPAQVPVPASQFRLFDIYAYWNTGANPNQVSLETVDWGQTNGAITGATNASPITITSTGHGLSNGNQVGINGVNGNTAPNGLIWTVANVTTNTFDLTSSTGNGTYTSGGTWYQVNGTRTAPVMQSITNVGTTVLVKSGDPTRRYVGTGMTTATQGQTEDSAARRYLWSYYNRVRKKMVVSDSTASWTYTSTTYRPADGRVANALQYVCGQAEDVVSAQVWSLSYNATADIYVSPGIGVNTTAANSADTYGGVTGYPNVNFAQALASYRGAPGVGYQFLQWVEACQATGTTQWMGSVSSGVAVLSGISGEVTC